MPENERYAARASIGWRGCRSRCPLERELAVLLHDLRGVRLQYRIGVVADEAVVVAGAGLSRSGRRTRFVTGPGPEAGGSNPGSDGWRQTPEKSGIAIAFATPAVGSWEEATVCPAAGAARAHGKIARNRIFRHCRYMPTSLSRFMRAQTLWARSTMLSQNQARRTTEPERARRPLRLRSAERDRPQR